MSNPSFTSSKMGANTNQDEVCMQEGKTLELGKQGVYALTEEQKMNRRIEIARF
jgi:hypothetical protein